MTRAWPCLLLAALLAGCATPPAPPAPPPVAAVPIVLTVPAPVPTTVPAQAPRVKAVLAQSKSLVDEARRYVAWKGSKPANIQTLSVLAGQVTRDITAMQASRRHGRYMVSRVRAARDSTAALSAFLANKGD